MRGLKPLFEFFVDLFGFVLPPWAGPVFVITLAVLLWPLVKTNLKTDTARKLMKRASRERGPEREKLEEEALAAVKGAPNGLVVVAELALAEGRKALAARAVDELRATKKLLPQLRKLERALEPPLPGLPTEACIHIEQLLSTGMLDQARARLAQARRKWPFDDDLEALEAKIAAAGSDPRPA